MRKRISAIEYIDLFLMGFIFLLLFLLPVMFTRVGEGIGWSNVFKIWQDRVLLIPIFVLNHWVLVPRLMLRKRYKTYSGVVMTMILVCTLAYYLHDEPDSPRLRWVKDRKIRERLEQFADPYNKPPTPVPPYADLLLFSLLIVSVDTGLSLTKNWHRNEEDRIRLEKENARVQLTMLRNQVSPHFFMNTLNNIYALIDADRQKSKEAVMKLSKLMRYMLYESGNGRVKLSREFEFIRSYVDLMGIRFAEGMSVTLDIPEVYNDIEIPAMLFISFIENAFKYGSSYEQPGFVHIFFEVRPAALCFTCINRVSRVGMTGEPGGIGLDNARHRLDLLFGERYRLQVSEKEKIYSVELEIPLSPGMIGV